MTVAALKSVGHPMHVDDILKDIKRLYGKDVPRGTIVTMLADYVRRGKVFRRTEPNTFELIA